MNRIKLGLAAVVVAVAGAALAASPAVASHTTPAFNPQTANVPYLAWRGEELRLVKCSEDINVDELDNEDLVAGEGQSVDWIVEDWSGYPFQPPSLEPSTVKFFVGDGEHADEGCVKADYVSLKAGLAQIKLVITDDDTGNPILKHQFLAGWMSLNAPVCRELSSTSNPGGGGNLGDPLGDGRFFARGAAGRVQCDISGNLPLGNNFTELGLPGSIRLPAETGGVAGSGDTSTYWDDLAVKMATTSSTYPRYRDNPWLMWDIHDDRAATEGHVDTNHAVAGYQGPCTIAPTSPFFAANDAVDACLGAGIFIGDGRYSRVWGDLSRGRTFGPYDPKRPDQTSLPDGKLDAGDVPMPAARVDVSIAPNSGAPTDISGVGSLTLISDAGPIGVYKCIPYTRDRRCSSLSGEHPATLPPAVTQPPASLATSQARAPHNHYAPYYSRWIPATNAPAAEASGTDGPQIGNNFPGYRGVGTNGFDAIPGLYDYWQPTQILREALGGNTTCLDRRLVGQPAFRQLPRGPQSITVYSDEHGEIQAYFHPGLGFYFDNLGVGTNLNNACDLEGVATIGTANIQAIARYPYQKTTGQDQASNVVTKTVGNLFRKTVTCVPKGPVPPITNGLAFICTATAIDVDGNPIVGEAVCFVTNGEGMREFPLGAPHYLDGLHR
ncbi:MAG: hypothetical protein ABR583_14735, partial [Gaiellaceae bacterium]